MAHHGWIFPVVVQVGSYLGTFLGGILTGIYGHVGKYSLDQAIELKELIVKIRWAISDAENHPVSLLLGPGFHVGVNPDFPNCASDLKSKLELIRGYDLIRYLRLVRLPPKRKVFDAAKLLSQLAFGNPQATSLAKKIMDLLK
jgi:hypothetical protein